jgi:predicted DNA-binding transcriptional regulator AlpA
MFEPMLVSLNEVSGLIGKSRRTVYELIATDQLKAVKADRNTRVVYQSVKAYVDNLPAVKIKPYHAADPVN